MASIIRAFKRTKNLDLGANGKIKQASKRQERSLKAEGIEAKTLTQWGTLICHIEGHKKTESREEVI